MKNTLSVWLVAVVIGLINTTAFCAVPMTIKGVAADLTGKPHDRPDITVHVRSLKSGEEIVSGKAQPDGSFAIDVPATKVPPEDVTLSVTADGTAYINGVQTRVRTNGQLVGLAGSFDSKGATTVSTQVSQIVQSIILIVPREECTCGRTCYRARCRR